MGGTATSVVPNEPQRNGSEASKKLSERPIVLAGETGDITLA